MKALSIKEPWASLINSGKKTIETRTWHTNYRGAILLCASKSPKGPLSGLAFASANLVDCRPMTKADEIKAACPIYPKAHSWILQDITPLTRYFSVKGQLGIFEVEMP